MSLSEKDKKIIDINLYSFEHNWKIDTYLFGEPFYKNGILYYKSNTDISICLYPLEKNNLEKLYLFIEDISSQIDRKKLSSLKIYGSKNELLKIKPFIKDTNLYFNYESEINNCEYLVNISTMNASALKCYRKAKKLNYHYKINSKKYLDVSHITIIKEYIVKKNNYNIDMIFFSLIPTILKRRDIIILDVFLDNKLIGFSIFHHFSKNKYFQLYNMSLNNTSYVHDYFLGIFIDNYLQNNESLYIGSGNTSGLKQFKSKWGKELKSKNIATLLKTNSNNSQAIQYSEGVWWINMIYNWIDSRQGSGERNH